MLFGIVRNAAFCCKKNAGQFGAEFFLRVVLITEPVAFVQGLPIQPAWVACPMTKLMKRSPVVIRGTLKCGLRRKMDCILGSAVERAVALIVADIGTRILQHRLTCLSDLPVLALPGCVLGNAFDLAGVEYGV